ncbi:SDR family oxidoreductase [Aquibacillus kalidii]|uniref:SDR family oxidoreductase n=1 Tax=Aquibacillus kalidii TaxID=2762597 RepID=UPI001648CABE|nr:SDR family oxidoreductase [Aquibacillus kalidii]
MEQGKLHNRIALVTGAGRLKGIGAAICKQLAKEGADIYFTYWSDYDQSMPWGVQQDEPEILKKEIESLGVTCYKAEIDLSNPENIEPLMKTVRIKLGEPKILVNNAAFSTSNSFMDLQVTDMDNHYAVNIRATTLLSVEFARHFSSASGGRIINLTSGQSLGAMPGELAYATTKGAVEAFTKTLSAEVAYKGITVNAVNPGPTQTGWVTEEDEEVLKGSFPLERLGEPGDVARLISFLASDDAKWITGQVIHSEGGFKR